MSSDSTHTTRAEYHADSDKHTVRESRQQVRQELEKRAVGRENAISGAALAEHVPVAETTVRDIITELRDDPEGPPISGASNQGYFIIDDADELDEWVEKQKERRATIQERIQANVKAANRRLNGGGDSE